MAIKRGAEVFAALFHPGVFTFSMGLVGNAHDRK
jgi:hypothetical protein